jgi:WD40 repeat protein
VSRWYWTSADQRFFAQKASDGEVNISDRATFEKLLTVSGKLINNLHFSPDSSLVLVSDREKNLVRVFTLSTDQLLRLARSRVTRSLTPDELERYLHIEEDQPHNLESSDYFPGPSK